VLVPAHPPDPHRTELQKCGSGNQKPQRKDPLLQVWAKNKKENGQWLFSREVATREDKRRIRSLGACVVCTKSGEREQAVSRVPIILSPMDVPSDTISYFVHFDFGLSLFSFRLAPSTDFFAGFSFPGLEGVLPSAAAAAAADFFFCIRPSFTATM
jgi:hypothetical protein